MSGFWRRFWRSALLHSSGAKAWAFSASRADLKRSHTSAWAVLSFGRSARDVGKVDRLSERDPRVRRTDEGLHDAVGLGRAAEVCRDHRRARLQGEIGCSRFDFIDTPSRLGHNVAFRKDRHHAPFLEGPDGGPGRRKIATVPVHRNTPYQTTPRGQKPVFIVLASHHETEHTVTRALQQHVVDATGMVADQNRRATFWKWRTAVDPQPVPDHTVRPVDEMEKLEIPVDLGLWPMALPQQEHPGKDQHAAREQNHGADTHARPKSPQRRWFGSHSDGPQPGDLGRSVIPHHKCAVWSRKRVAERTLIH